MIDILPDSATKGAPMSWGITLYSAPGKRETYLPRKKVPYTRDYYVSPTDVAAEAIRGDEDCLQWLIDTQCGDGSFKHWVDVEYYNLKAPWTSSVSQSMAASAFIKYGHYKKAEKALMYMILNHYTNGRIYEKGGILILNGWLYGYLAMGDFYKATGSKWAKRKILDMKVKIVEDLPKFITKTNWTLYDLDERQPASWFYHNVHIRQLQAIGYTGTAGVLMAGKEPKSLRWAYLIKKHGLKLPYHAYKVSRWKNE